MFMALYFPLILESWGGNVAALLITFGTQFGRVFYQCHWVGDTFVGASIGAGVSLMYFNIDLKSMIASSIVDNISAMI